MIGDNGALTDDPKATCSDFILGNTTTLMLNLLVVVAEDKVGHMPFLRQNYWMFHFIRDAGLP